MFSKFVLFATVIAVACAINPITPILDATRPAVDRQLIHKINSQKLPWKAGVNEFFVGKNMAQAKRLMGYKPDPSKIHDIPEVNEIIEALPTTYDASQQYPQCSTIGTIYNQADCGSCWAFGCVESAQDRYCIQKGKNVSLSFLDLVTCGPDNGCEGGEPEDAWGYVAESGLVTESCYPYDIPTCPPAQQPCLNFVNTPPCTEKCNDTESWNASKHIAVSSYSVSSDVQAIMTEIYTNGPVEACFEVYQDFLSYKSGVYIQNSNDDLGGHCIKIIGWGVENGVEYWLCNNSWTTYWGDEGQFKIRRGTDECGIEDQVVAGMWK